MENTGLKVLVHASAFFAPFLVPFILYLVVDDHEIKRLSIQALLFQVMMGFAITVSIILSFVLIGIPLLIAFGLATIIVPVLGIIKALNGETYNYPIVGRFF
ncbi:hypothetical protein NCCP2222_06310 [Sporosarcina sp. NCCP-2222]|uniref:DUF4870 domain-containing protein n=1 Tax=Sporosarcina sp. NCCP-2222 TaxID=2935073 RepID=UPI00208D331A|nr:DUF4870 domain-containing protein [Sporosarcina sp. NCCP-2222]GKV54684.1 hypothetical protein NCCP2222_06310 [Sporosarcina sp. NCCP-2222]